MKKSAAMVDTAKKDSLTWTIPLHVIMWTTIGVGLIMAMAVLLMH